jgi:hypothetical protein
MSDSQARSELCETITRCLHCTYVSKCASYQVWEYAESNAKSTAERVVRRHQEGSKKAEAFASGSEAFQLTLAATPEEVRDSED